MQGDDLTAATTRAVIPLPPAFSPEAPRKITEEERGFQAFKTLRQARGIARNEGQRKLKAAKVRSTKLSLFAHVLNLSIYSGRRRRPQRRSRAHTCLFLPLCCQRPHVHFENLVAKPGLLHPMPHAHACNVWSEQVPYDKTGTPLVTAYE